MVVVAGVEEGSCCTRETVNLLRRVAFHEDGAGAGM